MFSKEKEMVLHVNAKWMDNVAGFFCINLIAKYTGEHKIYIYENEESSVFREVLICNVYRSLYVRIITNTIDLM